MDCSSSIFGRRNYTWKNWSWFTDALTEGERYLKTQNEEHKSSWKTVKNDQRSLEKQKWLALIICDDKLNSHFVKKPCNRTLNKTTTGLKKELIKI